MKKICIPIFNRATYGRMKSLLNELSLSDRLEVHVALGSSLLMEEYGNAKDYITAGHTNIIFHCLDMPVFDSDYNGITQASGEITKRLGELFKAISFDGVIVVADRYETLPAAMAASYYHIPLIHIQGGEVTNNVDDRVRHAVTKLSDYHLCSTRLSKLYLGEMGEDPDRIVLVGCPSLDLIRDNVVRRVIYGIKQPYIIGMFHPETENIDKAFDQTELILRVVSDFCGEKGLRAHWYWPNNDPGREEIVKLIQKAHDEFPNIFIKAQNKPPLDFYLELARCRFIIGNSSSTIRETSYLGVPSINIGYRQGERERGLNCYTTDYDYDDIMAAMEDQYKIRKYKQNVLYGTGTACRGMRKFLEGREFSLKPTLTYPKHYKYRDEHFGYRRFKSHDRTRTRFEAFPKLETSRAKS